MVLWDEAQEAPIPPDSATVRIRRIRRFARNPPPHSDEAAISLAQGLHRLYEIFVHRSVGLRQAVPEKPSEFASRAAQTAGGSRSIKRPVFDPLAVHMAGRQMVCV